MTKVIPVILSGGSGERLWPASRAKLPKQFLPLCGPRSTFQETVRRFAGRPGFEPPVVICNASHQWLVAQQLAELGISGQILVEPMRRDSGPAVVAAAAFVAATDPAAVLLVTASDHMITEGDAFDEAVSQAVAAAAAGHVVTFGIVPSKAHPGYGYIRPGAALEGLAGARRAEAFIEKPSRDRAEQLCAEGYLWNSGNFAFRADTLIAEAESHAPHLLAAVTAAVNNRSGSPAAMLSAGDFEQAPRISIDHAIMERSGRMAVVPSTFPWSDIGSWDALWAFAANGTDGNVRHGDDSLIIEGSNNLVRAASGQQICLFGVDDLVVVAERDAILICSRERAAAMKTVVAEVAAREPTLVEAPRRERRPWGSFETIERRPGYLVKRIIVDQGGRLSLQRHRHRAERWVVVRGLARVTIDDTVSELGPGAVATIPLGAIHRLENAGTEPVEIVEVQMGDILSEDDIERLEDVYGRHA